MRRRCKQKALTDKQIKFVDEYFKDSNISNISKKLKISRQTAYTYLKNKDIREEIDKRRMEILATTTLHLQSNLKTCSDELLKIIKDKNTSPQIKINAINSVFCNSFRFTEQQDILAKLEKIEEQLDEGGDEDV